MEGLSPLIWFTSLAAARNLKLIFRAPARIFENHRRDGHKLSRVVLSVGTGQAILLIHVHFGFRYINATSKVADGVAVGVMAAFLHVDGYAKYPERLPDNVGLPIIRLRQQVIRPTDANAVMNPKQVFLDKQPPYSHAATYWPMMTLAHPSASGGASATFRRLGRLLPLAMAM